MANSETISSRILKLEIEVDKQSAQAVDKRIDGLQSKLSGLSKTAVTVGNSFKQLSAVQVESQNRVLKGLQQQESVLTRIAKLRSQQTASGSSAGGTSTSSLGVTGRAISTVGNVANIAGIDNEITRVGAAASQAAPVLQALGASEAQIAAISPIAAIAIAGVSIVLSEAQKQIDAYKVQLNSQIEAERLGIEARSRWTKEMIDLRLQELTLDKQDIENHKGLQEARLAEIQQMDAFGNLLSYVTGATGQVADAIKKDTEAADSLQRQIDQLTAARNSEAVATNTAKAAAEAYAGVLDEQGPNLAQQITTARQQQQQTLDQMTQAREREAQQELDILQRAADQKIAIAEREAQAEADALLNLQRSQAQAQIKLADQNADTRLAYQRQEAQSAREHARRLIQIRQDELNSEIDLIRERDFAGLAQARRNLNQKLDEENDNYIDGRKERLTQLKQALQDDRTAFVREREARLRAYAQQISDLRAAKKRELAANEAAARQEISRLQEKLRAEQAVMQARYTSLQNQETALFNLRQRLLSGAITAAQARSEASRTTTPRTPRTPPPPGGVGHEGDETPGGRGGYAAGGWMRAGQTARVNEVGQESFTRGGKTMWLPNLPGYFTPTQGGHVNPAGSSAASPSISISVTGTSKRAILREVNAKLDMALGGLVD